MVFDDDHAITREDTDSVGEQRFVTLGLSGVGDLLVVVYAWRQTLVKGSNMRKVQAEPYRDVDFSKGKRGPVVAPDSGKTKISIRLDNAVINYFRGVVEAAGGGNYQSLINEALVAHIQQRWVLAAMRKVVREELAHAAGTRVPSKRGRRRATSQPVAL